MMGSLSYILFQPVHHIWYNKDCAYKSERIAHVVLAVAMPLRMCVCIVIKSFFSFQHERILPQYLVEEFIQGNLQVNYLLTKLANMAKHSGTRLETTYRSL